MAIDIDIERQIHQSSNAASLEENLFTTRADRVLRRVEEVLDGRNCIQPPTDMQKVFLRILRRHQGKGHSILQMAVCATMHIEDRQVRILVQELRVTFGIQIGASRDAGHGGYYLIATDEEVEESTAGMYQQAVSMLRTVAAMRGGGTDKLIQSLRRSLAEEAQ